MKISVTLIRDADLKNHTDLSGFVRAAQSIYGCAELYKIEHVLIIW